MTPLALLVGVGILLVGLVGAVAGWRWQRRYAELHPQRRRPNAAIAGRAAPVVISLVVCGVGIRVLLSDVGLKLWQHLVLGAGFFVLAIVVGWSFLRWMRVREKTDATRRVATRVLVVVAALGVLAWGFVGTSN